MSIAAFQAVDPGSIPGHRMLNLFAVSHERIVLCKSPPPREQKKRRYKENVANQKNEEKISVRKVKKAKGSKMRTSLIYI